MIPNCTLQAFVSEIYRTTSELFKEIVSNAANSAFNKFLIEVLGYYIQGREGVLLEAHRSFIYFLDPLLNDPKEIEIGEVHAFRKTGTFVVSRDSKRYVMYLGPWYKDEKEYMRVLHEEQVLYTLVETKYYLDYFVPMTNEK